jgi:hypothetical protein
MGDASPFRSSGAFPFGCLPTPTLYTASPNGEAWRVKIIEGGQPHYHGHYPNRGAALRDAEALAIEAGGCFLR